MANFIKLSFLLALTVVLVNSEGLPQPKRGDVILGGANDVLDHSRSKVLIEKPVLLEVNNVETKEKNDEHNPEIQLARPVVDQIANDMAPLTKLEPASNIIGTDESNSNKDSLPSSVPLEPIPLIMPQLPFGMPAFMQQILDSLKSSNPLSMMSNSETSQTSEESGTNRDDGVRHGSLTILLMKSLKPANQIGQVIDDKSLGANEADQNVDGIKTKKIVVYKFMPKFRLGGKNDPDSDPNFMANNNDNVKTSVHLLGGIRDFDSKRFDFIKESNSLFGENDLDRLRDPFFNGEMPLIGGEDAKIENFDPSTMNENQDDSIFAKIRNFFNSAAHKSETFDPEFMRHHSEHGEDAQHKPGKKCMMMNFMRLRSNIYFRTVLHMLFFTGLLMIILCLTMLTIRNIKRRRALRYYNKNVNVATIEGSNTDENEQSKDGRFLFRFRFGGKRGNGASNAKSSSFLVQAPPAYDQITIGGEKKQQQESKEKYSKLTNEDESDTKSLTSLPGYEQTVIMKESDILTNETCHPHHHHHHGHHHHHPHPHHEEEK